MTTLELRRFRRPVHEPLGTHGEVYWWRRHFQQFWTGWRGSRVRWLFCWRYALAVLFAAYCIPAYAQAVHSAPIDSTLALAYTGMNTAPSTTHPVETLFAQFERVRLRKARKPQRVNASIVPGDDDGIGTSAPGLRKTLRVIGIGARVTQFAVVSGFRYVAAQAYYESARPTKPEPSTWYYIASSDGSDAAAGTSGAPFQTLFKSQGSHLGGGRVGAPDVGFRIKGTFTNQGIIPAINCTADEMAIFEVWPGFSATVDANNTGSNDPYALYCSGRPYIWVEGITLDGVNASDKYAIYAAPNGSTYSTNLVIIDCPYTGSLIMIGSSDCWLEGLDQDNAGANGFHMGPTAAVVVALAGLGAGNVNSGTHSYMVQFKIENSPSSTAGTTEYSLTGASNGDYGKRSNEVTTSAGNGRVTVTVPICVNANCTARLIYRTTAGSSPLTYANYKLLATINDNSTTTYADNTADGSLGAALDSSQWGNANSGDGIDLICNSTNACHRTVVYQCSIGNCGHIGLAVGLSGGVTDHEDIRIAFCHVNNTWTGGIAEAFTVRIVIECNDVLQSGENYIAEPRWVQTTQGIIVQGDDAICRYNRVRDSYGQGIFLQGNALGAVQNTRRASVTYNTVCYNYGLGLLLNSIATGDVKDNVIENNIFYGNCRQGMTSLYETHGYYNGALYDVWVYVASTDASLIAGWWDSGTSTKFLNGNIIRRNIISTTPNAFVWVGGARGGTQALTLTQAESAFGSAFEDNFSADPEFISATATDPNFFALSEGSPAVDAGIVNGYGYSGSAPDLGVHEVEQ